MARNLDLTALRAFVVVSECGSVTKAAGMLHLTQSAVSMQLKRLEESLGVALFDRSGRSLNLSRHGEQLLGYGRRILELNDEVWGRMTAQEFEGTIRLGVPADIVYPHIPSVLKQFASDYPRVKVDLISSFTSVLKDQFSRGEVDIILTTENTLDPGGETLSTERLTWVGAHGGSAWRRRPLRLAFEYNCVFRSHVQSALDKVDIKWEMGVESDSTRTVEASISADLAVHACLEQSAQNLYEIIKHGGELPMLPLVHINMYAAEVSSQEMVNALGAMIRERYATSKAA